MPAKTRLTDDLMAQICALIREGAFRRHAAAKVDLDEVTFSRWYHRGAAAGEEAERSERIYRKFFLEVNKAEASFAEGGMASLKAACSAHPKHFQWLLSRRFPDLFGRRDNVEEVSAEDKAQQTAQMRDLLMSRLEKLFPEPEAPEPTPPVAEEAVPPAAEVPNAE